MKKWKIKFELLEKAAGRDKNRYGTKKDIESWIDTYFNHLAFYRARNIHIQEIKNKRSDEK